jgi:hypothetical protein
MYYNKPSETEGEKTKYFLALTFPLKYRLILTSLYNKVNCIYMLT